MKMLWTTLLLMLLVACEDATRAVDPVWGKQACAHCAMLVSEPRFAAELTTTAGDRAFFDDPGCMATYLVDRAPRVQKMWVRDAAGAWIETANARFQSGAASPMDYGFAAAADGSEPWSAVERAASERAHRSKP